MKRSTRPTSADRRLASLVHERVPNLDVGMTVSDVAREIAWAGHTDLEVAVADFAARVAGWGIPSKDA